MEHIATQLLPIDNLKCYVVYEKCCVCRQTSDCKTFCFRLVKMVKNFTMVPLKPLQTWVII